MVVLTDLNRRDIPDAETFETIQDIIVESGPDAYVNLVIDEVFKKQFNALQVKSLGKKDVNGKIFYEIHSVYISEKSYKDIEFISYMHITKEKIANISIYSFSDNWPNVKGTVMNMISTLTI